MGPKGDAGPKGDPGTAGLHVVSQTATVASNIAAGQTVSCPAGDVATGGGGHVGSAGIWPAAITRSEPHVTGGKPDGWVVVVANTTPASQEFTAYAICAPGA
jgi:hypothetical protein